MNRNLKYPISRLTRCSPPVPGFAAVPIFVLIGFLIIPAFSSDTLSLPLQETEKIELLITYIESMHDTRFIRNNKEYSSAQAGQHVRKKWSHVKKKIKTAEQFIEYIASKSSLSGKPYQIKTADGKVVSSESVLIKKLAEING